MAPSTPLLLLILLSLTLLFHVSPSTASTSARKLILVQEQPLLLPYHHGRLLKGNLTVNLLFYGRFSPSQRSIVSDFIRSLSAATPAPSVASWWRTTERYRTGAAHISLGNQLIDSRYSLGKSLTDAHLRSLALRGAAAGPHITAVLTASDVSVAGFCMSRCAAHGVTTTSSSSSSSTTSTGLPYLWVGDSTEQCPGQCAWPFYRPIYGPQTPPLVAPNGDAGMDGVVVNLATVIAGAVTNPFGDGFYQGPAAAPLEAVTACSGAFGNGAYPGYPGVVPVDPATGASYNAHGLYGRKYLLPAMWDPLTKQCVTLV